MLKKGTVARRAHQLINGKPFDTRVHHLFRIGKDVILTILRQPDDDIGADGPPAFHCVPDLLKHLRTGLPASDRPADRITQGLHSDMQPGEAELPKFIQNFFVKVRGS